MIKALFYISVAAFLMSGYAVFFVLDREDKINLGATNLISSVATSTIYGGLNLSHGCFTANGGACVGSSNSSQGRFNVAGPANASVSAGNTGFATSTTQLVLPANTLTASSTIDVYVNSSCIAGAGGTHVCDYYLRNSTGVTLGFYTESVGVNQSEMQSVHFIVSATSTNSQQTFVTGVSVQSTFVGFGLGQNAFDAIKFSNINWANAITLTVVTQSEDTNNNGNSIGNVQYIVNQ